MREILSIQYLRAIAAAMVVVYHCFYGALAPADRTGFAYQIWSSGVDVFFVVSGFVMWVTTSRRSIGPLAFWRARIARIVPLYWVALAFYWPILVALRGLDGAPSLSEVILAFGFVPYRDPATDLISPYLTSGWTLTHEMIFYAVFGAGLLIADLRLRVALVVTVFAVLIGLRVVIGAETPIAFRLTSPLALEFLAGMALAIAWERFAGAAFVSILRPLAAVAAVAFLILVTRPHVEAWPRALVFGVPAVAFAFLAVSLEDRLRARPIGWLKRWGDASYSIYLANEVFLVLVDQVMPRQVLPLLVEVALLFAASIAVGLGVNRFVEVPLGHVFRHRRLRLREAGSGSSG
ncbi:acyltransferase family protein [Pinisolibacter aquiterrae]|uniref:acyltransferase family protein n=1 Tax=Pinisolibacter aquiterrae TaxID=2815579 RepID=UPI0023676E77|nr:acyltransferase [Pinisolibacter aquiterrae]MCC8233996.1 acyltransferase [Pinisolibacter aquiterrae]